MHKNIHILSDKAAIATYMAEVFVDSAEKSIASHGHFVVALSGGGTPQPLYELLATPSYAQRVDWENVHFFWGDERCVPISADGNNYKQTATALLSKLTIPEQNIWRVKTELPCASAAQAYQQQLAAFAQQYQPDTGLNWPIFDMVLLGMGGDGHTASLFPNSPLSTGEPTRVVVADYAGRPANRVTLTESVFNSALTLFVLVAGADKAHMLNCVLEVATEDQLAYPVLRIRPKNGSLSFILDTAAANNLSPNGNITKSLL